VPKTSKPREQVENHGRACTQVLFLGKAELGFFHFFRDTFHPQKIPLAENTFLQAGNGAKNTKEKSKQCFTN
jgi:hypothetical protein